MLFDCGLRAPCKIDYVFLTHRHSDHSERIRIHSNPDKKQILYVPCEEVDNITRKVISEKQMTVGPEFDISKLNYEIVGVTEGFVSNFTIDKTRFRLRVFKCFHSTPCVGYGLSRYNDKLKPELKCLSREELANMRKEGEMLTTEEEDRFFLYLGDTTHEVFSNPEVLQYKCIMVECTFIHSSEIERAVITDHMHWNNLEPIINTNPQCNFILYHFSRRYTCSMLEKFFEDKSKPNMYIWISS